MVVSLRPTHCLKIRQGVAYFLGNASTTATIPLALSVVKMTTPARIKVTTLIDLYGISAITDRNATMNTSSSRVGTYVINGKRCINDTTPTTRGVRICYKARAVRTHVTVKNVVKMTTPLKSGTAQLLGTTPIAGIIITTRKPHRRPPRTIGTIPTFILLSNVKTNETTRRKC